MCMPLQKHPAKNLLSQQLSASRIHRHGNRFKTANVPLFDYLDFLYIFNVTVGTPAKTFQVQLDTTTSDFYLIGSNCTAKACDGYENSEFGGKWKKDKYSDKNSTTYIPDFEQFYISITGEKFSGWIVGDRLDFGGSLVIGDQRFGALDSIPDDYGYYPLDGAIGLGWRNLSQNPKTYVMDNLFPKLDKAMFTIWLDRHLRPVEDQKGGLLTFGALDTDYCSPNIQYAPLTTKTYWEFNLDGFQIGSYKNAKTRSAMVDPGQVLKYSRLNLNSMIEGLQNEIEAVLRIAGAQYNNKYDMYMIDCENRIPDLIFKINGNDYSVPSSEFIVDPNLSDTQQCAFMVGYAEDFYPTQWILGQAFIRQYCIVHDFENAQVGFALASHTES
ncbi:Aspartic protease [Aphelenchoides bicaudatus]|nr:Aspartic protease [Aphelenchoides bicaudatus]